MADFTEADINNIDRMFDAMDIDHDGEISIKELVDGLAKQGIKDVGRIAQMFKDADADGNGKIEWTEFLDFTRVMRGGEKKKKTTKKKTTKKTTSKLTNEKRREILRMFHAMDPNGNGFVDSQEFENYITNQNIALGVQRIRQLYETIRDSDKALDANTERKGITINDLIAYFENETEVPEMNIDPNAIKSISDIEAYITASNLTGANVCNQTLNTMATGLDIKMRGGDDLRVEMNALVAKGAALDVSISSKQTERWKPFASFKRRVDRKTVMASPSGILADLLPGQYDAKTLAAYDDLPPIEPEKTIVYGVRWEEGKYEEDENGKKTWITPSKLIFPNAFKGEIATDIATTETLKYYGAMLIESTQQKVDLDVRQVLQDFDYKDNYLEKWVTNPDGANGAALEHHPFAHLDCPLGPMKTSGYYMLAKWLNVEKTTIAITGFQVPTRHTVMTPKDVLHTNNYLKGTWRTMLADGFINEGKMFKAGHPISFTFKQ